MFLEFRPDLDKLCQSGVFLHDFVQASGQDRIAVFRKFFIYRGFVILAQGFESPWSYFISGKIAIIFRPFIA
jgi:hypothetical protein